MSDRYLAILGCSSQQHTRLRNQGAYFLRFCNEDEGFLFDPGEGTQRQFIFADIAPTGVTRIFISHFHGDHCLGLGSMLMRLNLDKVKHPIHCYFPASGRRYYERLRDCASYFRHITIIEHPVEEAGLVDETAHFLIYADFLNHGIDTLGWRIEEKPTLHLKKELLEKEGIKGPFVKKLLEEGFLETSSKKILLEDVSYIKPGDIIAVVIDTLPCEQAVNLAKNARILLCESTYLDSHKTLAEEHKHLTARQAAEIALKANAEHLILTHFSARYTDLTPFKEEAKTVFSESYTADDLKKFLFSKNSSSLIEITPN